MMVLLSQVLDLSEGLLEFHFCSGKFKTHLARLNFPAHLNLHAYRLGLQGLGPGLMLKGLGAEFLNTQLKLLGLEQQGLLLRCNMCSLLFAGKCQYR